MAVDQQRKDGIITMEYGAFLRQLSSVKVFQQETYAYKGQNVTFYKDAADGEASQKAACGKKAVRTIADKDFNIPNGLRIYCTSAYEAQNRAFNKDPAWNDIAYIILGTTALNGGRLDATSNMNIPGFVKGLKSAVTPGKTRRNSLQKSSQVL